MKQIIINGTNTISGEIAISGAKNSVVALIPAAILSDSLVKITNVPKLSDCDSLEQILLDLNCDVIRNKDTFVISTMNMQNKFISNELSQKLRASYYFMGSLLAKYNHVEIGMPGGCDFGTRPIDLHLKGFEQLGAKVTVLDDRIILDAPQLNGTTINLEKVSVGATINLLLAATKANGITTINNAACEPEIDNVIDFLNNMGAKISGKGTSTLQITGVKKLGTSQIAVIPDRIETGTYMILATLLGDLKITNTNPIYVKSICDILKQMGVNIEYSANEIIVHKSFNNKPINIETNPYPGFPTDLGQIIAVLMTQINGQSTLTENIYNGRTKYLVHLSNMGADINLKDNVTTINGPTKLIGTTVEATDLRAGAAFLVAGAIAEGSTTINKADLILRGYENIVEKLDKIGINIIIQDELDKNLTPESVKKKKL